MNVLTKALFAMFMVTIVTVTTGFSSAPKPAEPAHTHKDPSMKAGEPWYGGKPRPPLTIHAPAIEPVAPDSNAKVVFTIAPDVECTTLTYRLRATDGIRVLKEAKRGKLECTAGSPTEITATVHVPEKTEGSVILSVSFEKDGKVSSTTRSVAIETTDAPSMKQKKGANQQKSSPSVTEETYAIEPADSAKH